MSRARFPFSLLLHHSCPTIHAPLRRSRRASGSPGIVASKSPFPTFFTRKRTLLATLAIRAGFANLAISRGDFFWGCRMDLPLPFCWALRPHLEVLLPPPQEGRTALSYLSGLSRPRRTTAYRHRWGVFLQFRMAFFWAVFSSELARSFSAWAAFKASSAWRSCSSQQATFASVFFILAVAESSLAPGFLGSLREARSWPPFVPGIVPRFWAQKSQSEIVNR